MIRKGNKNKGKGKRVVTFGLMWLFVLCIFVTNRVAVHAADPGSTVTTDSAASTDGTARTVKVGYYPVANYQDRSEDGTYHGFGYDYFMQIQKYTRWNYEFVEASYADCLKMLLSGEIDLMSGLVKTDERAEQMLFSDVSVSSTQNKLYCKADKELYYEDYENFDGCQVAIMKGTLHDSLDAYCEAHHFQVKVVEYDSMSDMEEALLKDEVDMVFATSISEGIDTKIVGRLAKIPLYYAVAQKDTDVLEELNSALQKIIDNNPNFYTKMSEKYMVDGANATATFTKEEMDYIQSEQKVYVIMNANWAPISWYDSESGQYKGIVVDILENIKRYSGLDFVYCLESEFNDMAVSDPGIVNNVLAILADDNAWAVSQNVMMTNHIADASVVMVTKRGFHQTDSNKNLKIALPERFYISWCMRNEFSEDQIVYYDTVEQCLDAINQGKADATYVNELVSTYYLSMLEYSGLFATADSGYNEDLAFAVNKDSKEPLLGIMDKSLLCIGTAELDQIVLQNSIADQKITLQGLYYTEPKAVIAALMILMLVVAAGAFAIYAAVTRKKRQDLELEKEQEIGNARTEFFMMISHELRTPLNAIVGYLNLTEEECSKKGIGVEYLKRSMNAARQLTDISQDMLEYTKIASDTFTFRDEVFDIKEVIRNVEQNISLAAAKKEISFHFGISDIEHEFIIGDKLRFTQIMQNILSNAVKFTDRGKTVNASASQIVNEDGSLEFRFVAEDTGRGMTEDFLKRVCTPFNQGDRAYSRTHGGLGLGLYLTKYYLKAMNGAMEVTSEEGKGSTFVVTIPFTKARSEQILDSDIDFSHVRVLIGGSSPEENQQLKNLLKRLKIKSDTVTTKELAVKRLCSRAGTEYEYKLCVVDDSFMEDDLALLEELNAKLTQLPALFVMTQDKKRTDSLAENPQINKVLYKPVFQSELFDAVMNMFGEYSTSSNSEQIEDFSGLHAMLVEDNHINADILMRVLKKTNMQADICENGKIAVERFAKEPKGTFDIIFMDIQMPVMDGYEATRRIRQLNEVGREIPIVAVSANAFPEDIEKSLSMGMNEHLSKPINGKMLYRVIREYCRENR